MEKRRLKLKGLLQASSRSPTERELFVAVEACDMCKGFDGLHLLMVERLNEDIKSGAYRNGPFEFAHD